jgi:uncharacterized protein (DUF1800 family)
MKNILKFGFFGLLLTGCLWILSAFLTPSPPKRSFSFASKSFSSPFKSFSSPFKSFSFPYKKAGLSKQEAAAHLLERFTYGATPGQIDQVLHMGLENWFRQQLDASQPEDSLDRHLVAYPDIGLSNTEVCSRYPPGFVIRSMAIKDSVISKDSVDRAVDKKAFNARIQAYMDEKGFKSDQDLYKQFIGQNLLRAVYSRNQLQEVLTDFWFNHFNVSFTKGECAQFIPAFERDVIRPNALGKFDQLLIATTKSPAMLYYLDNFTSVGPPVAGLPKPSPKPPARPAPAPGTMDMTMAAAASGSPNATNSPAATGSSAGQRSPARPGAPPRPKNVSGLNENYAREVMELHTLGVDGGYTQQDVTQAARVLTGWTIYPISDFGYGSAMKGLVTRIGPDNLARKGFIRDSDFLFTPNRHDHGEKIVLGHDFPANTDPTSGYQEGIDLLEMLAHHASTAKFICRKLAIRFVSDDPPQELIDKMARSFLDHDGDIREVLITMVSSKEFWDRSVLDTKIKSPFELAVSAVRALNATIADPYPLYNWIARMGEKKYYYQAPTGFPDRGRYWINTGLLLNRMDFCLALTAGQIGGVKIDLGALIAHRQPETPLATLTAYSNLLLPARKSDQTIRDLTPLFTQPGFTDEAGRTLVNIPSISQDKPVSGAPGDMMFMGAGSNATDNRTRAAAAETNEKNTNTHSTGSNPTALIAGMIIGSPEYQKR